MSSLSTLAVQLESDVLAARDGDASAFGRLVDETKSAVTAIALAIIGDYPASQDIAQDVFLAAWRNLGKLRSPASFLPWLRQTTRNRARTWVRDQGRRRLAATRVDDLLPEVVDGGPDPAELLDVRDERRLVAEALADLPGDAREVVILYYREGESVAQVADLLDLTPEAVRQRLSRGRRRMRETVAERLSRALSRTAPGAAFTAAVLTGLNVAAPTVAASAAIGTGAKVAGTSVVAKLAIALAGIVAGASGGILGVLVGVRWEAHKYRRATPVLALCADGRRPGARHVGRLHSLGPNRHMDRADPGVPGLRHGAGVDVSRLAAPYHRPPARRGTGSGPPGGGPTATAGASESPRLHRRGPDGRRWTPCGPLPV
jgi:RNA polymerase sigma factor (sigma-70 family)